MSKRFPMMCGLACALLFGTMAAAADWPQWGGPNRDGISPETGLLKEWPEGGPKLLWSTDGLGQGYSSVSVVGGMIYATGIVGGNGFFFALNTDGGIVWKLKYGPEWRQNFPNSRTTPTIEGDRAYLMSGLGTVVCIDLDKHEVKWSVDTAKKFGGRNITWGIAESPLICGDMVICTPGGKDASLVALDKKTGETIWQTKELSDRSAYCSPMRIKDDQKDLIVTMTESNIVGVNTEDGTVLWKHPYRGPCQAHPNTPLYHKGRIYVSSGYNAGGVALNLAADGTSVEVAWPDKKLDVHHGGVVLVDGHVYGANWLNNNAGNWVCITWDKGELKYETPWKNKGSIICADGMLYCYEEKTGTVGLVEATPDEFKVVGSFVVPKGEGEHWAHPVIAGGRLYIRHGGTLMAYDIKAP